MFCKFYFPSLDLVAIDRVGGRCTISPYRRNLPWRWACRLLLTCEALFLQLALAFTPSWVPKIHAAPVRHATSLFPFPKHENALY